MAYDGTTQRGETLVELLVAIGIFAVAGFSVLLLVVSAFRGVLVAGQRTQAVAYARESWEAARSIGTDAYNRLAAGTYGLSDSGGTWVFSGSSDLLGAFTRQVVVGPVVRDGSGNIAGSGTGDIHTRQVTTTISWVFDGMTKTVSYIDYLTNWDAFQWFEDTSADFADGSFSGTAVSTAVDGDGAVALQQNAALWACAKVEGSLDNAGSAPGNDVAVSGNYAFMVTNNNTSTGEFVVIEKTDPMNPTVATTVEIGADAYAISIAGQYAYVATADNSNELRVIDITTPTTPAIVGSLNLSGAQDAYDVVASGSRAYLVRANDAGGHEFYTLSIGTPSSPSILGSADLGNTSRAVTLSGTHAYAVTDDTANEFKTIDVSVDASPTVVASLNLAPATIGNELAVSGSYAYVVTDNNSSDAEFFVINIATPALPSVTGSVDLGNGANTLVLDGTTAFVGTATANQRTFQVVDASTPSAPTVAVNQKISNFSYNGFFWDGTRLYVASQDNDAEFLILKTLATADWSCPEQKAEVNVAGNTNGLAVYVVGTTLYLGTGTNSGGGEFFIYDVTTPTSPILIGSYEASANVNDVVVSGNYAYLATSANASELIVVNITVPSLPVLAGIYNAAGNTDGQAVAIVGTKVMLTQGATFYNINAAVPTLPTLLGSVALGGIGYRIDPYNATYAYVATANDSAEVRIINFSGATPSIAGSIDITGTSDGRGLWVKGTQLYVAVDSGTGDGLYVYDISSPTTPTLLDSLSLGQASRAVVADDNEAVAFSAVNKNGQEMKIVDTTTVTAISISGVLNLFNGYINDMYFANDTVYTANQYNSGEITIIGKLTGGGGGGGGTTYPTTGTYVSSIFDATDTANWNTIEWSEDTTGCASADIRLQVRTASTSGGLSSALWQGPDGEDLDESDYFTLPVGELIHFDHNNDQYLQYRASFTGDGSCTPQFTDITITYTPY